MVLEEIIQKASELNLPDFLKYLVSANILSKIGKEYAPKLYEIIRNKFNEKKYAFVPNKDEAETLKKLGEKSTYKRFKKLLPTHWGNDAIRTAEFIMILEQKKDIERIKEIKGQVFRNLKLPGLRLVEMVQTDVIRAALDYVEDLKSKYSYSQEDINREFENLLMRWERITIFVKSDDAIEKIKQKSIDFIERKEPTFFLFAKGSAIDNTCLVIAELIKEKYVIQNGYIWFAQMIKETTPFTYYCGFYSSNFLL